MKHKTIVAGILALTMALGGIIISGVGMEPAQSAGISATAENGLWQPSVVAGVFDERVPFGTAKGNWGDAQKFGTKLIEDASMGINRGEYEILVGGGWGQRYTFNYGVDLTDFEIVLDMNNVVSDSQLALIFGIQPGVYVGAENGGFALKILKHESQYGVVVSSQEHVATIPTMTPAPSAIPWDGQNSGYVFDVADGILKIKLTQYAEGTDFTLQINDGDYYTIPVKEVTGILGEDLKNIYLSLGCISDGNEVIRVKSLNDGNVKEYEKSAATIIAALNAYVEAAEGDLSTAEAIVAAENLGESVAFDALRSNDVAYWQPVFAAAGEKIAEAKKALGAEGKISILEEDIKKLIAATESADSNESIAEADEIVSIIETVDFALLDGVDFGEYEAAYQEAMADYQAALEQLETARKNVVLAYLSDYEEQAKSVSSIADINLLTDYRNAIYVNLQKLDEQTRAEVSLQLVELQETIAAYGVLDGWTKESSVAIYNDGTKFEYSAMAGSGSTLSYNEKLMANQFSVTFRITEGGPADGWVALSLTKEKERFYVCTDSTNDEQVAQMQANPGIVLLLELQGGNRMTITVYLIKATHTSFYSASRGSMVIDYTVGEELNIRIQAEDDANSTYANIFFNDQKFTGTNIKNSEIKSSLGTDFKGYFSICEDRGGLNVAVDSINGHDASGADIAEVPELPTQQEPVDSSGDNSSESSSSSQDGSSGNGKKGCGSVAGLSALAVIPVAAAIIFGKKKRNE